MTGQPFETNGASGAGSGGAGSGGISRQQELAADRALFGLTVEEQHEFQSLATAAGDDVMTPDKMELTAAALDLALHGAAEEPLPTQLRQRILAASGRAAPPQAIRNTPATQLPGRISRSGGMRRRETLAWFAAAAAVLVATILGLGKSAQQAASPASLRTRLLAQRSANEAAILQVAWTRGADAAGAAATGDIVWSDAEQAGVMRFRGLAANDPAREQYQLWIFDAQRNDAHPVDGGVFDVPSTGGDVLVAIQAKLPVARAKMFAVTVERPGGVVVSDRSRLPLLAQAP